MSAGIGKAIASGLDLLTAPIDMMGDKALAEQRAIYATQRRREKDYTDILIFGGSILVLVVVLIFVLLKK